MHKDMVHYAHTRRERSSHALLVGRGYEDASTHGRRGSPGYDTRARARG